MNILRYRSTGTEVIDLQRRLRELGYIVGVDGIFGTGTRAAVIQFQKDNKLAIDGEVGDNTRFALIVAKKVGFQIQKKSNFITIVKIPISSIAKMDLVDSEGSKETVRHMQERTGATIMINGILYGMVNGREIVRFVDEGKMIAPGIFSLFGFMIFKDGSFKFGNYEPGPYIKDCFGAAPPLVRGGEVFIDMTGFERDMDFINFRHPRLAIGRDTENFYIILVDGRRPLTGKLGMGIRDLAQLCKDIGCIDAMNLDGGGSTIAMYAGKPINDPLMHRPVANGLGIWIK